MFRLPRIRSTLAALFCLSAVLAVPAHANDATAALTQASKYLQQGLPAKAVELINRTMTGSEMPSDLAGKALLMRARAYEKMDKYAYALADYNQAIFQGLSSSDRRDAKAGRDRIMAQLGVGGSSGSGSSTPQLTASSARTEVKSAPTEERTGGSANAFSRLFSTSAETRSQSNSSSGNTRSARAVEESRSANDGGQSGSVQRAGDFAIQMAALHNEDGAIYEVNRIEKRYGEWLGGRTPSITIRPTSDGGTLYKVIAEPYKHGEGIATCELLKTKGLSCMLISR